METGKCLTWDDAAAGVGMSAGLLGSYFLHKKRSTSNPRDAKKLSKLVETNSHLIVTFGIILFLSQERSIGKGVIIGGLTLIAGNAFCNLFTKPCGR